MTWQPTLGDLLSGPGRNVGSVERRFLEVGFDLTQTLAGQSPRRGGHKNSEGINLSLSGATMEPKTHTNAANDADAKTAAQQPAQMAMVPMGIPLVVQIDKNMLEAVSASRQPPLGQDLARFSGKVVIAGTGALGFGLLYHWLTKPPAMDMG